MVRAAYVAPLLAVLAGTARRSGQLQTRLQGMQEQVSTPEGAQEAFHEVNRRRRPPSKRDLDRFAHRITQVLASIEYFLREPLGWREGTTVVWAGMRGAVTVAAAQTLPDETPQRSVLVFVAYAVAALSLLVQGGTIGPLMHVIAPKADPHTAAEQTDAQRTRIIELLRTSTEEVPRPQTGNEPTPADFGAEREYRLAVIAAQRSALLDARDNGTFDADVLEAALANLDAAQISIEMHSSLAG